MLSPNIPNTYISPSKLSRDSFTLQSGSAGQAGLYLDALQWLRLLYAWAFLDMSLLLPGKSVQADPEVSWMFDSHNRAQPDRNEYEHVFCSHVQSNTGRCWLDLLHECCPQAPCESHAP